MQTEDPLGVPRLRGQPGHGQRVRARRQDRGGGDHRVQLAEDLLLDLVRLRHDLDDQLRVRGGLEIGEGAEAGEDVVPLLLRDALAAHGARGGGLQGGDGLTGGCFTDVDADDLAAGTGQDLGDAGSHGAETDDGNGGERDVHHGTPG